MNCKIKQYINWTFDRIWPRITSPKEQEPKPVQWSDDWEPDTFERVEKATKFLAQQATEREQLVDRKLLSLLAFASVATSVIIAGMIGVSTLDIPATKPATKWLAAVAVCLSAYVALQLINAVLNTVRGLSARPYKRLTAGSIVPAEGETKDDFQKRQLDDMLNAINQNQWVVNRKVDNMNVAHEALKNVCYAAIMLIVAAVTIAILQIDVLKRQPTEERKAQVIYERPNRQALPVNEAVIGTYRQIGVPVGRPPDN